MRMRWANSLATIRIAAPIANTSASVFFAREHWHLQFGYHGVAQLVHRHEEYVADHELNASLPLLWRQAPHLGLVCLCAGQVDDALLEFGNPRLQSRGGRHCWRKVGISCARTGPVPKPTMTKVLARRSSPADALDKLVVVFRNIPDRPSPRLVALRIIMGSSRTVIAGLCSTLVQRARNYAPFSISACRLRPLIKGRPAFQMR